MSHAPRQTDLFADEPVEAAFDFETPLPKAEPTGYTKNDIREMLTGLILELRTAETLPWDARTLRGHRAMAPYMAEWLKGGEGDRLLGEFRAELVRLGEEPVHRKELYEH